MTKALGTRLETSLNCPSHAAKRETPEKKFLRETPAQDEI